MSKQIDDLFDDEVTTGATLDSGTTIGGNTAFHLGNDGQGSGLDAETVDGQEPVQKGKKYSISTSSIISPSVQNKFASPSRSPHGVGVDETGCIWNVEHNDNSIYELNQNGTVQQFWDKSFPRGLGVDSNGCLWISDDSDDCIFQFSQTGSSQGQKQINSGGPDPRGVGIDSNDCIWNADHDNNSIYEINQTGTVQSRFASPSSRPEGVGVDSNDCIWNADTFPASIYKLNQTGTIQTGFSTESTFPQGVGIDSNDCIWYSDSTSNSIYQSNQPKNLSSLNKL